MESIPELRKICQTTAQKDRSNVYMRYVSRFLSVYITRFLLTTTSITANQVSLLTIATGILAALFLAFSHRFAFFIGAFLLQLWYLFDCCDGEVARYRQFRATGSVVQEKTESSLTGAFIDTINHYVVHGLVPLAISFSAFQVYREPWVIFIGFLGSISQISLLALFDAKSKVYLAKIKQLKQVDFTLGESGFEKAKSRNNVLKWMFVALHYSCTYPTVMNVVLLVSVFNFFVHTINPIHDWRVFFLLYYAFGTTAIVVTLFFKFIKNNSVDQEFYQQFHTANQTTQLE